jgi:adenylate cyclase
MDTAQRRLCAIMFTDMVGYTKLSQSNESMSLQLLEEQQTVLRRILPKYSGREVKTMGDAFLVEFPSALQALECALEAQKTFHEMNTKREDGRRIHVRIGVHLGDVVHKEGDIYGDAVNIASRVGPLADPGGICFTQQVYDQVWNKFQQPMQNLGRRGLKNVEGLIEIHKVVMPWETPSPGSDYSDVHRLAVMPLVNTSPDPNDSYFADGLTQELISTISSLGKLRVISRTSVMAYKNTTKKLSDIARELGVGTVLEGSVRKVGNRVRVSVELIDAKTDEHMWVSSYDRQLDDVFSIQSEIARQVASSLSIGIRAVEDDRLTKKTSSAEAYQDYLRGQHHLMNTTELSLRKAVEYFSSAVFKDTDFAQAYSGLAKSYYILGNQSLIPYDEAYELARSSVTKALQIDGELASAHAILGSLLLDHDWEFESALKELRNAVELNPSDSEAHLEYSRCLSSLGRMEEAIRHAEAAASTNPLDPSCLVNQGNMYLIAGREGEAMQCWRNAQELYPNNDILRVEIIRYYLVNERYSEAEAEFSKVSPSSEKQPWIMLLRGHLYGRQKKPAEALEIAKNLQGLCEKGYASEDDVAFVYAGLSDREAFFGWMSRAVDLKHLDPVVLRNYRSFYPAALSGDPRWIELLERAGMT